MMYKEGRYSFEPGPYRTLSPAGLTRGLPASSLCVFTCHWGVAEAPGAAGPWESVAHGSPGPWESVARMNAADGAAKLASYQYQVREVPARTGCTHICNM
jgi:hypothetical protein